MGERGAALVFVAMAMVGLLGLAALVIDLGRAQIARAQLQTAADSAALAAARALPDTVAVQAIAATYANLNDAGAGPVTSASDIVVGHWDAGTQTFTASGTPENAVRIITRRSDAYGNPITNFFRLGGRLRLDERVGDRRLGRVASKSHNCMLKGLRGNESRDLRWGMLRASMSAGSQRCSWQ